MAPPIPGASGRAWTWVTPVDARALLRVPPAVDFATAASVPCPALTAWLALDKLPAREDGRVLISGAGRAVGRYAVRLAVQYGYEVNVMCHPRHWARLRALGARACLAGPIDAERDASDWPREQAGRFLAIVDSVRGATRGRAAGERRFRGAARAARCLAAPGFLGQAAGQGRRGVRLTA